MIRLETRGVALLATLDAPATRNALDDTMLAGLADALERVRAEPTLRALVLRGAGGHFCAGGDFRRFQSLMGTPAGEGEDPIARHSRAFGTLLEALADCEVATVAVVEGAAMGGGLGLAACCDIVLAATSAQFATPEVTLGLPPAQIAPFVAARIGEGAALRLMLTGRRLTGEQAQAIGLVDEVLWPDALQARMDAWLADLARAEPGALRATKAVLRQARHASRGVALDAAARHFAEALRGGRAAEGLAAFTARRPPDWVPRDGGGA